VSYYKTNPVRKRHGFTWREEYLLGLLQEKGEIPTKDVLAHAGEAMSENTSHKYLTKLIGGGYVLPLEDADDKRFVFVRITEKGRAYLKELGYA
jgi:DNA-binding MarR family transcriptional regulator